MDTMIIFILLTIGALTVGKFIEPWVLRVLGYTDKTFSPWKYPDRTWMLDKYANSPIEDHILTCTSPDQP
jgi:hypothetical protein